MSANWQTVLAEQIKARNLREIHAFGDLAQAYVNLRAKVNDLQTDLRKSLDETASLKTQRTSLEEQVRNLQAATNGAVLRTPRESELEATLKERDDELRKALIDKAEFYRLQHAVQTLEGAQKLLLVTVDEKKAKEAELNEKCALMEDSLNTLKNNTAALKAENDTLRNRVAEMTLIDEGRIRKLMDQSQQLVQTQDEIVALNEKIREMVMAVAAAGAQGSSLPPQAGSERPRTDAPAVFTSSSVASQMAAGWGLRLES